MPADPPDDLTDRLAAMGFRRSAGSPAEFTAPGRGIRVHGTSAEVLVFGEHWVDAELVSAAIDGIVPTGLPERGAGATALGAARLPAYRPPTRTLDQLHQIGIGWSGVAPAGEPGALEVEVTYNYFDGELFLATWDSITADRDAVWRTRPTPAQATTLAHALWLATGGELAPEPVGFGEITLLPILGDRCEVRVLESADHPKLVGEALLLDLDVLGGLHATLRYFPRVFG